MAAPPRRAAEVVPADVGDACPKSRYRRSAPSRRRRPRPKPKCPRSRQTSRRLSHPRSRQKCSSLRPMPPPEMKSADGPASVSARRDSDGLRLTFSFSEATPAALFRRADTVWLLFDSTKPIDVEPIRGQGGAVIAEVSVVAAGEGAGDPHASQPSANGGAHRRGSAGRHELDGHFRRRDANADATAGGDTKHRRSHACQCQPAVAEGRPSASA